jgi:hypothetical protein
MSRIQWVAQVACEYGGPAIVADVDEYAKWMGASPYAVADRRVLHYWGQFTDELPDEYAQDGGHAYRRADSLDALRSDRDALLEAVRAKWSDAAITVDDEAGEAHVLLPDDRQMWIEFGPKSAYEEACDGEGPLWEHTFATPSGREGTALFWEKEGPGDFFVGVSEARDELVLLRTWVDEEELEDTAKAFVDAPSKFEFPGEDIELRTDGGRVVVGYSPFTWLQMVAAERLTAIAAQAQAEKLAPEDARARVMEVYASLFDDRPVVMLDAGDDASDVAAAVRLKPGTYRVAAGRYDPEDDDAAEDAPWSCIWCRFTLAL